MRPPSPSLSLADSHPHLHLYLYLHLLQHSHAPAHTERRKKAEADNPGAPSAEGTPAPAHPDETGNDTAAEHDDAEKKAVGSAAGHGSGRDAHPPTKRYRLTEAMKGLIWQLVCLSNECCRIENEKK